MKLYVKTNDGNFLPQKREDKTKKDKERRKEINEELQSTVRRKKKLYCDMIKLPKMQIDKEKQRIFFSWRVPNSEKVSNLKLVGEWMPMDK